MTRLPENRTRARSGRSLIAPWFLVSVSVVASFAIVRAFQRSVPGSWRLFSSASHDDDGTRPTDLAIAGWEGSAELHTGERIVARLAPYHRSSELDAFRSASMRERFGLADGALYRLALSRESDADAPASASDVVVNGIVVRDEGGVALADLFAATKSETRADVTDDPLYRILGRAETHVGAERVDQIAAWGRRPAGDVELLLDTDAGEIKVAMAPAELDPHTLPRWFERESVAASQTASLEQRVRDLEDELRRERLAHLEFVKAVGRIRASLDDDEPAEEEASAEPEPEPEPAPEVVRAEELGAKLRALFKLTGLYGLDLLSPGALHDGAIGPVLFRMLDARGNLVGSLAAERLRMEASRASRVLTVVLEDGYESHQGQRVPFEGGTRRIALAVDPEGWLDSMPELFSDEDLDPLEDDGTWRHSEVRAELNRLLGNDSAGRWFRVHSFGGILDDEIVFVHVQEFDRQGHLLRRLFADRMRIEVDDEEVVLVLEGGAYVRGEEREAFRDGVHRIHLTRASIDAWKSATLPGVSAPPDEG